VRRGAILLGLTTSILLFCPVALGERASPRPYGQAGAQNFLPLSQIAEDLGLTYVPEPATHRFILKGAGIEAFFSPGMGRFLLNGRLVEMEAPAKYTAGKLAVPSSVKDILKQNLSLVEGRVEVSRPALVPRVPARTTQSLFRKVVIDPGHGGHDPGAIGHYGLKEKDVNLDIALRLASILRTRGLEVILTRSEDKFLSLPQRTQIANETHADAFISIHANSGHPSARGFETYIVKESFSEESWRGGGYYDDDRRAQVAAREANISAELLGRESIASSVEPMLFSLLYEEYRRESLELAKQIQVALDRALAVPDRGVKFFHRKGDLYVLKWSRSPVVLVEVGFLSNHSSARLLATGSYRQRIAEALAQGVLNFRDKFNLTSGFTE